MTTVAVIGDVGGHADALRAALVSLGADRTTLALPAGLVVVQVGDLVHRGPDSPGVLQIVAGRLAAQPGQWVQLAGNHEGVYLPHAPTFDAGERLGRADADLLQAWWAEDRMRAACALRDPVLGDLLVTHAGLTRGFWEWVGAPATAAAAAEKLNQMKRSNPQLLWAAGLMLGDTRSGHAGPMWANAGFELYPSWLRHEQNGGTAPFGQVHGHTSAYQYGRRRWLADDDVTARLLLDPRGRRHVHGRFAERPFIGIDPTFGKTADVRWAPLVLPGADVTE